MRISSPRPISQTRRLHAPAFSIAAASAANQAGQVRAAAGSLRGHAPSRQPPQHRMTAGAAPVAARLIKEAEDEPGRRKQHHPLDADRREIGGFRRIGEARRRQDRVDQRPLPGCESAGGQIQGPGLRRRFGDRRARAGSRPCGRSGPRRVPSRPVRWTPSGYRRARRRSRSRPSMVQNPNAVRFETRQQARFAAPVPHHHVRLEGDGRLQRRPDAAMSGGGLPHPGVRVIGAGRQGQVGVGSEGQHILVGALIQRQNPQRPRLGRRPARPGSRRRGPRPQTSWFQQTREQPVQQGRDQGLAVDPVEIGFGDHQGHHAMDAGPQGLGAVRASPRSARRPRRPRRPFRTIGTVRGPAPAPPTGPLHAVRWGGSYRPGDRRWDWRNRRPHRPPASAGAAPPVRRCGRSRPRWPPAAPRRPGCRSRAGFRPSPRNACTAPSTTGRPRPRSCGWWRPHSRVRRRFARPPRGFPRGARGPRPWAFSASGD